MIKKAVWRWQVYAILEQSKFLRKFSIKKGRKQVAKEKEMRILSRQHFFDLLDSGQEEFRIETTTPGKNARVISEDAPFDRDDPMSYVLVDIAFDRVKIFAKGEFSAHDIAESQRTYGATVEKTLVERVTELESLVSQFQVA